MTWYEGTPLTPLHAWDAVTGAGATLEDRVGALDLVVPSAPAMGLDYYGFSGNSNPIPFSSPITLPSNYVMSMFRTISSEMVAFYTELGDTSRYYIDVEGGGGVYQAGPGGYGYYGGVSFGQALYMTLVKTPTSTRLYVNGAWLGGAGPAGYADNLVGGIGYVGDGNSYNLGPTERVHAIGMWAGEPTIDDLILLETQCRLAVKAPDPERRLLPDIIAPSYTPLGPRAQQNSVASIGIHSVFPYLRGGVNVSGVVKEDGLPVVAKVRIHEKLSGRAAGAMWTGTDGAYSFENLEPGFEYYIVVFDSSGMRNALVKDRVIHLI